MFSIPEQTLLKTLLQVGNVLLDVQEHLLVIVNSAWGSILLDNHIDEVRWAVLVVGGSVRCIKINDRLAESFDVC